MFVFHRRLFWLSKTSWCCVSIVYLSFSWLDNYFRITQVYRTILLIDIMIALQFIFYKFEPNFTTFIWHTINKIITSWTQLLNWWQIDLVILTSLLRVYSLCNKLHSSCQKNGSQFEFFWFFFFKLIQILITPPQTDDFIYFPSFFL